MPIRRVSPFFYLLAGKCEWRRDGPSNPSCGRRIRYWELCISCGASADAAVKTAVAEYARGILASGLLRRPTRLEWQQRTNARLPPHQGNILTLLDEGDELADHALSKLCEAVVADSGLDMLYADEDRLTSEGRHVAPFFKPDWSPESLLAWMYTGRPGVYRTSLVRKLGGFRAEYGSAYEYDLLLRIAAGSPQVRRVADVLYHRGKTVSRTRCRCDLLDEGGAEERLQNHLGPM